MKPYYDSGGITIYQGDCREILPSLPAMDTCLTDPPYGLKFMGKDWDWGVPGVEFWRLISTALQSGAMCLAFGGTRTFHRLACAIEDAGLELRDCLMWLYGSGFPKSLDISKVVDNPAGLKRAKISEGKPRPHQPGQEVPVSEGAKRWNGWGTGLKPAWEPVLLAMKPIEGTFAENALKHGVAGLNIDGSRIESGGTHSSDASVGSGRGHGAHKGHGIYRGVGGKVVPPHQDGRFPANLLLDEEAARMLDRQSGDLPSPWIGNPGSGHKGGRFFGGGKNHPSEKPEYRDSGGASRFFYTAKASGSERNDGYDVRNTHPTVKPLDLMRYLCKLTATPTGGVIIDPFMGSGTTLLAARDLGRRAVGIEIEEKYCEVAAKRLAQKVLFGG